MIQFGVTLAVALFVSMFMARFVPYMLYAIARLVQGPDRHGSMHAHVSRWSIPYEEIRRTKSALPHVGSVGNGALRLVFIILWMAMVSFVIDTQFVWSFLAVLGGLGASALLIREGVKTGRNSLFKLCFYVAGFILLYEELLFIIWIWRGLSR